MAQTNNDNHPPSDTSNEPNQHLRHIFLLLALSSITALFADTNYLPLVSIFHPSFYLAYIFSCKKWERVAGWVLVSLFRAVPARDYFYNETSSIVAYVEAFAIILVLYGGVTVLMMVQCWIWDKSDELYDQVCNKVERANQSNLVESTPLRNATSDASNVERQDASYQTDEKGQVGSTAINAAVNSAEESNSPDICLEPGQHRWSIIHRPNLSPLVLPILLTSLYQMVFRYSPIGGAGNPAMGLAQVHGLRQIVSLFGEIYLVFWIGWIASILVGSGFVLGEGGLLDVMMSRLCRVCVSSSMTSHRQNTAETRNRIPDGHVTAFVCVSLFMMMFGSVRELSGRGFYLVDMSRWPTTIANEHPLKVSCLTRAESDYNQTALQKMVVRTNERLSLGDDLIIWSESAVDETVAPSMFKWNLDNPGALVAPAFFVSAQNSEGKVYNRVQMMQDGAVIASYDKNRPVPIIESYVVGGSRAPDPIEITFTPQQTRVSEVQSRKNLNLSTAMAICFDLDFPYLLQKAHDADLVVGPSWYWASLGYNLWGHNTFRAIENGFTLIKCSEYGITGSVDPFGRPIAALPTFNDEVHTFEVPVPKGIYTMFGSGGWMFGWVCVGLGLLVLLSVISLRIC